MSPAAHLTCVGSSKDEIRQIAQEYWDAGITHIVALRGDPPADETTYTPHPHGYAYADDLVKGLREVGDFELSVAAYPEAHPAARSAQDDLAHLKRKFDAGAHRAITQYFFNLYDYLSFLERARAIGITQPIVPGLLPVGHYTQMVNFSARCGASVPEWIHERFSTTQNKEEHNAVSVATAAELAKLLVEHGAGHIHFYTLNRADLVSAVCRMLGIYPK